MTPSEPAQEDVRRFWFGEFDADGLCEPSVVGRWFDGGEAFDIEIRERFGESVDHALAGGVEEWAATPAGLLALVVTLDQFPRNLFRGSGRSFAGDARALGLARRAVDSGWAARLRPVERLFLFLPFEHAEDRAEQTRSCALYATLLDDVPAAGRLLFESSLEHAERHRVAIERFGRFPGRNEALGRESTPEERAFLEEHPAGF